MKTKILDTDGIITLKQQKFSQSDPVLIRQFWKNCSPIQFRSGQNWLQSRSSPIQSWSVLISEYHKCVTLGGSTKHFTTDDGFKVMPYGLCKIHCVSDTDSAVGAFSNQCRGLTNENVGLMMWAITQDTWQKTVVNKTDNRSNSVPKWTIHYCSACVS